MSAYSQDRLDARGVPIVVPTHYTPGSPRRKHHTLVHSPCAPRRTEASIDHDTDEVKLCRVRSSRVATTPSKRDRSLLDEYDDFTDACHKSHLNHISRMFYQGSPQGHASSPNSWQDASTEPISARASPTSPAFQQRQQQRSPYGSPLQRLELARQSRTRQQWISPNRSSPNGQKRTLGSPRPLNFHKLTTEADTKLPSHATATTTAATASQRATKRRRTLDFFALETNTVDYPWPAPSTPESAKLPRVTLPSPPSNTTTTTTTPATTSTAPATTATATVTATPPIAQLDQRVNIQQEDNVDRQDTIELEEEQQTDPVVPQHENQSRQQQQPEDQSMCEVEQQQQQPDEHPTDDAKRKDHPADDQPIEKVQQHQSLEEQHLDEGDQQQSPQPVDPPIEKVDPQQHQEQQQQSLQVSKVPAEHGTEQQCGPEKQLTEEAEKRQESPLAPENQAALDTKTPESRQEPAHMDDSTPTPTDVEKARRDAHHSSKEKVRKEMDSLMQSVKTLNTHYRLLDKIGCGTFSSVYKALDLHYDTYDNSAWDRVPPVASPDEKQHLDSNSDTPKQQRYVALKQIYATSSPKRMAHEIKILQRLRGAPCVSQLISAFRQHEYVFLVMPYFKHDDFKDCIRTMTMADTKCYLTSLLTALKHLHSHGILHRDIKPNNFLYNMKQKTGMLIDFGLAQREDETRPPEPPKSNLNAKHGLLRKPLSRPPKPVPALQRPPPSTTLPPKSLKPSTPRARNNPLEDTTRKPGYIKNDPRKSIRANRAGTRGFRAPEVLLRVTHQTVAIDIWSVGVILLSLLTGRYPFFIAHDEGDSLIEIASIFGMTEMKECAALHNRTFETNIATIPTVRKSLTKLCQVLNTEKFKLWTEDDKQTVQHAVDLVGKMLSLDYRHRITAADALNHPFLADPLPLLSYSSSSSLSSLSSSL